MLTSETKTNKTTLVKNLVALFLIFIGTFNVAFGQTATYTISSTSAVSTSGTAPSGSSATYAQTYTPTVGQMTSSNSTTLTLSGYTGMRITQIVLEMKSNNSSGSGNLSVMAGSTSIGAVATSAFNNASWNGSWSSTYVNITKTPTAYTIGTGENVVIKIAATANSLYIQKYTITYELVPTCTFPTTQATTAAFSTITNSSMNLSWTSGNGNGRIVVMKEASAVSGTPTSGTAYTANAAFGLGNTIATNEFVVYNGTGNSVSVSGLDCGKTYHIKVFEYNTTDVCYNTTSPTSASAATLITASPTAPSFTQTCGSTTFAAIPNTATENTFWQTSASGTSETDPADVTKTVSSATTIYLRTKSSTGCWSNATTVSPAIISSPSITSQPVDQNGTVGGSATFSVVATDATGYQWQISTNGGSSWSNVSGATSPSLTVSSLTLAMNGYQYRVNVNAASPCTDVVSSVGTLSVVTGPCFEELFTGLTGYNTTTSGSSTAWNGNTSFITLSTVYQAGNAIRLGSGSSIGSITSSTLSSVSGDVTVTVKVKGWTTVEGDLKITLNGVSETRTYTAKMADAFETISVSFTSVPSNSILIVETTAKRAFIDDIQIFCAPSSPTLIATPSSLSALNYTVGSGPSTAQTFTLTGSNLDGSAVNLQVANTDFQISSDNASYSNSISFPAYNGTAKTIYVRLKSGLAVATYTDAVAISGGGVAVIDQPSVAISGAVLAIVAPIISSSSSQAVVYGSAASYQIVASQSPTSYSASGLPTGLSINTTSGLISGTPTVDVGSYTSTINATNAGGTGTLTLTWNITAKPLTISGLSAANKVYDGTVSATLSGTATLTGIVFSDDVSLSGTPTANFANKNVGTAKTVTISGYTLSGTKAGNYSLAQPALTANINAKSLTISGVSANNKVYDGNTNATLSGGTLSGVISPDVVTLSGGGTFASSNAGTGISVTSNLTLAGADGGNYTLTQPTGLLANITKVNPVFTTSTITLNVGATYDLPGANVSSTSPGTITYSISSGGNATLAGITISGVTVGIETLTVTQAASTNYNAGSTTVSVNVITFTYLNGDVRPLYDYGNFSYNDTWEEYSGGSWTPRSLAPQNSIPSGRIIIHKLDINGAGNVTTSYDNDILVLNGGSLILDATVGVIKDFIKTGKSLEIQDGGKVTLNGQIQLNSGANLIVRSGGTLELNSSAIHNNHPFWNGNENFEKGSFVVIRKWDWSAIITTRALLNSSLSSSQITSNANGYKFGNLIIDTELGDDWTLVPGSTFSGLKLCDDNLEILNESPTYLITGTSNNSSGFIVNGDFIIYDGRFNFGTTFGGNTSHSNNYIVYGDFICISNDKLILHEVQNGSSTPTGSLTVHGNFEIGNGVLTFSNQGSKKVILKEGDATNSRYIDVATLVINVPFEIEDGYRILKSNNLEFGNSSSMLVKEDASLNFGFKNSGLPLHILSTATATNNSFTAQVKSTLYITSPSGIMSAGDLGNVQTNSRTFATVSPFADYHYIGKQNQITGTALPFNARNLTINNEVATNDVTLSQNLTTTMLLTMLNGNVRTDAYLFELGKSLTLKGTLAHTNGFVVGKMRRWFNGTNSGNATGLYPMGFEDLVVGAGTGVKNRHTKIEFSNAPADGGHLTVQYIGTPMGPDGIPILAVNSGGAGFDVITTEDQGYWKFDNESGKLINAAYTISCTGEGYQVITDLNKLTLLKRVVANGPNWFCPGAHIATSGSITMPTVSRSGVSNWSNFGFGGGTGNPLPVELTAFQVSCDEDQIQIHWSTASELNSSHFEVEKSNDLINWNLISETAAAGNSNKEINYQTSDLERSSKVTYYRLKQVDLNGESKVYGPISTLCEIESNSMKVYPNPTQGEYQVEINWTETSTNAQLQLLDLTGKVIHEMDLNLNTGTTHLQFNQENLQMGTYLIRLHDNKSELNPIRLVITK